MSRPTDVEVSRALNALVTTLNDQGASDADPGRWLRAGRWVAAREGSAPVVERGEDGRMVVRSGRR